MIKSKVHSGWGNSFLLVPSVSPPLSDGDEDGGRGGRPFSDGVGEQSGRVWEGGSRERSSKLLGGGADGRGGRSVGKAGDI